MATKAILKGKRKAVSTTLHKERFPGESRGYRAARGVFLEGCSAPWALTADYVSGKIPGPGDAGYDPTGSY